MKVQCPDKFLYLLDIPRKVNDFSTGLYEEAILKMVQAYEEFSGRTFEEEKLRDIIIRKNEAEKLRTAPKEKRLKIGLMGARCSRGILNLLENHEVEVLFDLTCTGLKREFQIDTDKVVFSYASALLNQIPCMRMTKAVNRENYAEGLKDEVDGIIYHTVKFCDNYGYEYAWLKEKWDKPLLQVETDATKQCAGQIRTRIEAFLESIDTKQTQGKRRKKKAEDGHMYVLGIDSGSRSDRIHRVWTCQHLFCRSECDRDQLSWQGSPLF